MPSYGLEWVQHWLMPEEDRAVAESWKKDAKCLDIGDELAEKLFFPIPPDTGATVGERARLLALSKQQTKEGKRFCRGLDDHSPCPVLMECLEYALEEKLWVGVWGGTSGRERRKYQHELQHEVSVYLSKRTKKSSRRTRSS